MREKKQTDRIVKLAVSFSSFPRNLNRIQVGRLLRTREKPMREV